MVTFSAADVEALREARQAAGAPTATPVGNRLPRQAAAATDAVADTGGWRELVATLRADLDATRSQLETERVRAQQTAERAAAAEAAYHTAAASLANLRASVALWYTMVRRPLWRLRPLPPLPAEVTTSLPALAKPGR